MRAIPPPLSLALLGMTCVLLPAQPSIEGADGFGAETEGGEGGRLITVTSLADDGPGSLRAALSERGPRLVRFEVEGEIALRSRLRIREGAVTLDAGSAPGGGITLTGHGLDVVNAEDVILRGLRLIVTEGGASGDGVLLWGKDGGVTRRVLVDRCSIHGATDEGVNTWGRVEDATFRWCLIADAAPPHSKGWLSGESCDRITIHHCLLAFCDDRNPKLEGGHYQVVNNVFAGWRNNNAMKLRLDARVNLVGNVFLPGPASDGSKGCVFIEEPAGELRLFMEDNLLLGAPAANDAWSLVTLHQQGPGGWTSIRPAPERFRVREPFAAPDLKALPSSTVLDEVLDHAGAAPRDARDARVVARLRALQAGTASSGSDTRRHVHSSGKLPATGPSATTAAPFLPQHQAAANHGRFRPNPTHRP